MRTITTIGTALLALGIASTTLAIEPPAGAPPQQGGQSGGKGGKGGGGQNGERPGRGNRPDFKTLDKNGDGFITQDEVPAEAWERMKKADKNGDGKISPEELQEARPGRGRGGNGGPGGQGSGGSGGQGGSGGGAPPAKQGDEPK